MKITAVATASLVVLAFVSSASAQYGLVNQVRVLDTDFEMVTLRGSGPNLTGAKIMSQPGPELRAVGLQQGDVITALDGHDVVDLNRLSWHNGPTTVDYRKAVRWGYSTQYHSRPAVMVQFPPQRGNNNGNNGLAQDYTVVELRNDSQRPLTFLVRWVGESYSSVTLDAGDTQLFHKNQHGAELEVRMDWDLTSSYTDVVPVKRSGNDVTTRSPSSHHAKLYKFTVTADYALLSN